MTVELFKRITPAGGFSLWISPDDEFNTTEFFDLIARLEVRKIERVYSSFGIYWLAYLAKCHYSVTHENRTSHNPKTQSHGTAL